MVMNTTAGEEASPGRGVCDEGLINAKDAQVGRLGDCVRRAEPSV